MAKYLSRRSLLQAMLTGAAGLAGASLIGCDAGAASSAGKPFMATLPALAADGTVLPPPAGSDSLRSYADRLRISIGTMVYPDLNQQPFNQKLTGASVGSGAILSNPRFITVLEPRTFEISFTKNF